MGDIFSCFECINEGVWVGLEHRLLTMCRVLGLDALGSPVIMVDQEPVPDVYCYHVSLYQTFSVSELCPVSFWMMLLFQNSQQILANYSSCWLPSPTSGFFSLTSVTKSSWVTVSVILFGAIFFLLPQNSHLLLSYQSPVYISWSDESSMNPPVFLSWDMEPLELLCVWQLSKIRDQSGSFSP